MNNIHLFLQFILFILIIEIGFKKYTVCKFREELFSIRNELFDLAYSKNTIHFDSKAYREMEQLLNGTIRFAHRIKFFDFMLIAIFTSHNYPEYMKESKVNFGKEIEKSLRELTDDSARVEIRKLRAKYQVTLVKYLYSNSLLLIIVTASVIIYLLCRETIIALRGNAITKSKIKGEVKRGIISSLKFPIFKIENEACLEGA